MEADIFDRFACILTTIQHENNVITPRVIKDTYSLLDYTLSNRMYEFLINSTWGPLNSIVYDYLMIRAEKNTKSIEPMAYKLAYSFFFKQGEYLYASGAMMRLSELCLSQASILLDSDDNPANGEVNRRLETEVRNLIIEAQKALSIAANVVGCLSHASYFEDGNIPKEFILGAKWGVSKTSQKSLAESVLQDAHSANINKHENELILDNFYLIEQEELEWTAGQIEREFMKITAMVSLSSPDRLGYIATDGISMLAACDDSTRCYVVPSQVLRLPVVDLVYKLACRGDIEQALSVCSSFSMGPNIVLQAIINHMILILDFVLSMKNDTQPILVNSLFQIHHLLTTVTVYKYPIKDVDQNLKLQLSQHNITDADLIEFRERFLCELGTCRIIIYDILKHFADDNGFLFTKYCNNSDRIFCASNLFAEILISAIAASSRKSTSADGFQLKIGASELLKYLNLLLDGLIEKAMDNNMELFELYLNRFGVQNEFQTELNNLLKKRSTFENKVLFRA